MWKSEYKKAIPLYENGIRLYREIKKPLNIRKKLIEKHDSVLHLESEKEKGSRFWFTLASPGSVAIRS